MVKVENIVAAFEVEGKVAEYVPFGNGHINETKLVTMDNGTQYVLVNIVPDSGTVTLNASN